MSEDPSQWAQLKALRLLTDLTGMLHEAQVIQLRYWPRVLIQNSVRSDFSYDHDQRLIVFTVRFKRLFRSLDRKRVEMLVQSVREMLGDDVSVRVVRHDGKLIYESEGSDKEPPPSCQDET